MECHAVIMVVCRLANHEVALVPYNRSASTEQNESRADAAVDATLVTPSRAQLFVDAEVGVIIVADLAVEIL